MPSPPHSPGSTSSNPFVGPRANADAETFTLGQVPSDSDTRIAALERAVGKLSAQGDNLEIFMTDMRASWAAKPNPVIETPDVKLAYPLTPVVQAAPLAIPATMPQRRQHLKPAVPINFDGDRTKGRAFMSSCRTYIRLSPEAFVNDTEKIVWAMSYMKSGRAHRWAERAFDREISVGRLPYTDWVDFEESFKADFLPLNAAATAVNRLEGITYFQARRPVDEYLDEFLDLVADAGYSDPRTVVVKFRRGLDRRITVIIAGMTTDRPADNDPDGWYVTATLLEQNRLSDEAFMAASRPTFTPAVKGVIGLPRPAAALSRIPTPAAAPATPDLSRRKDAAIPTDTCRRCGEVGHWANECKLRYDIRYMDADEITAATMDRMVALDVKEAEERAAEQAKEAAEVSALALPTEGFGSSNG